MWRWVEVGEGAFSHLIQQTRATVITWGHNLSLVQGESSVDPHDTNSPARRGTISFAASEGKELDGETFRRVSDHSWQPVQTTEELQTAGDEIRVLTSLLNDARLMGFLAEALAKRPLAQ